MATSTAAGIAAPDFEYTTGSGERKHLAEVWSAQPTLILWLRHFG